MARVRMMTIDLWSVATSAPLEIGNLSLGIAVS
jgi:hypothetical protein